ncbi:MAG: VanZ family protein [Deltaproteobacteria bacterium]|nr:VanZ family protein [Deltaproteobacteria bacterium]
MVNVRNQNIKRVMRWAVTISYAAVVMYLSFILLTNQPNHPYADKVNHAVAYFFLSIMIRWSLRLTPLRAKKITPYIAALIATLYGGMTEIFQIYIPYRDAEWADAIANALGAFTAIPISALLIELRNKWRNIYARSY